MTDETHLRSWFRDQVLHPHETQHTFEEIAPLFEEAGFQILATSLWKGRKLPEGSKIIHREKQMEGYAVRSLKQKRKYFPGFFTLWARKGDGSR